MPSTFEFCLPTSATSVPDHPVWLHEVKHNGYRVRLEREGNRVRLITRGGYDWSDRFPRIVEAAHKNRHQQFVVDGEAVLLGADGISDFNGLHSRRHDEEVQLYTFDCLALDGEDLRRLPLSMRKTNLARLLARRSDGIFVAAFEQGEIGPDLFRAACDMGLEGLVSKRADRPYRAGRCRHWIKVKNRKHPAYRRVQDRFYLAVRFATDPALAASVRTGKCQMTRAQVRFRQCSRPVLLKVSSSGFDPERKSQTKTVQTSDTEHQSTNPWVSIVVGSHWTGKRALHGLFWYECRLAPLHLTQHELRSLTLGSV